MLAKRLCDELGTANDVLLEFVDEGYDVYEVVYDSTPVGVGGLITCNPFCGARTKNSQISDTSHSIYRVVPERFSVEMYSYTPTNH